MRFSNDCGYFNEEQDSEYAPLNGDCRNCYRFEICDAYFSSRGM